MAALQVAATTLAWDHQPIVSRVDLDAVALERLTEFQRFVLSSDSLSLFGCDRLTRRAQRIDRSTLARLVTPDVADMVQNYRAWVVELDDDRDDVAMAFASRIIGKDLLKGLRGITLLRGGEYEVNIERIFRGSAIHVPEFAGLAGRLFRLYQAPTSDARALLHAIDDCETFLLPAMRMAFDMID